MILVVELGSGVKHYEQSLSGNIKSLICAWPQAASWLLAAKKKNKGGSRPQALIPGKKFFTA